MASGLPESEQQMYLGCNKSDINVVINASPIQTFVDNHYIEAQGESTIK